MPDKALDKKQNTTKTLAVVGLPVLRTWPARSAKRKFGIEINDCRTLKAGIKKGESVEILREVAEDLIASNLVKLKGGKS